MVYIRQSTLAQVREHTESTARQYALATEAARLGWEASKIVIIDADLGLSGRSASMRSGFKELVSRVCMGEVGAVFGLEISRLARSSADLQRLLEFCSITDTLIVDADGVYDLQSFNDRLLLGLKGTMSEAELHVLAGRLQESKRAAARRGDLRFPLPVGYVFDEDRRIVKDTNEEIRIAVSDVFAAFEATGSAYGVVGVFRERRFPRRAYGGAWSGDIRWGRLTHSRVLGLLSNPTYTGTYVYGRYRSRRIVDPDGTIRTKATKPARGEWLVNIPDHHPAYTTWNNYLDTERRLSANHTRSGARPPREGAALLQGLVMCGGCGRAMSTLHTPGRSIYDCTHSRHDRAQTPGCRSVVASLVDAAVAPRLLTAVAPDRVALALAMADELEDRRVRSTRSLELQLERSRYEAARAERAFHQCEPENRLVARSLEQRWEEKLTRLTEAEGALAAAQASVVSLPTGDQLAAAASELPRLWAAPTTSAKDRKRLLRALVADVTLTSEPGPRVRIGIRWRTGASEELVVTRPGVARRTPAAAIELVRNFAELDDAELVTRIAAAGLRTGGGRAFDRAAVRWIRYAYEIPGTKPAAHLREGELTIDQVADRLDVAPGVIYSWVRQGHVNARRASGGRLCVHFPTEVEDATRRRVAQSTRIKPRSEKVAAGGAV
ncbi:MAG: recombinase family protein [Thermoanaerobaculia bacterium]